MRVDQVIPSLSSRDAVGAHTVAVTEALRAAGMDSDIFYGTCTEDLVTRARPVGSLGRPASGRWLMYQSSIGSPVFDVFAGRPEPKLVNYHNMTPAALLQEWEPSVGHEVSLGSAQLARVASRCRMGIADSAFNEVDLVEAGFACTATASPLIETVSDARADTVVLDRLAAARADGSPDFLFVGKISPHKAQHDLVKMLAVYRRVYHPGARLHLVGSPLGTMYEPALQAFVGDLGLGDAVRITGSVTPGELEAYYQACDVFVSASEHEGFGVPLVEAMGHRLPVVAFSAAAVPETVGIGGLLLGSKEPLRLAAAVHRVVTDEALRARLVAAGITRAAALSLDNARRRFVDLVTEAVAPTT